MAYSVCKCGGTNGRFRLGHRRTDALPLICVAIQCLYLDRASASYTVVVSETGLVFTLTLEAEEMREAGRALGMAGGAELDCENIYRDAQSKASCLHT